jgi:hypothetical protein
LHLICCLPGLENCTANSWNSSGEYLTSKKAQLALNDYLCKHLKLHDEIDKWTGVIQGPVYTAHAADCDDDTDVPLSIVDTT